MKTIFASSVFQGFRLGADPEPLAPAVRDQILLSIRKGNDKLQAVADWRDEQASVEDALGPDYKVVAGMIVEVVNLQPTIDLIEARLKSTSLGDWVISSQEEDALSRWISRSNLIFEAVSKYAPLYVPDYGPEVASAPTAKGFMIIGGILLGVGFLVWKLA